MEIDDAAVERARKIYWIEYDSERGSFDHMRRMLQAALDQRVGEADRRKVQDRSCGQSRRYRNPCGRRCTDETAYTNLPLATPQEPEIHVSEAMVDAGIEKLTRSCPTKAQEVRDIYRAMRKVEMEEAAKPFWRLQSLSGACPKCGAKFEITAEDSRSTDK